jgi:SanA protein
MRWVQRVNKAWRLAGFAAAATIVALLVARLAVGVDAQSRIFDKENVPAKRIAIVFGAGLSRNGNPSPELGDRVATAAELYRAGKVDKLLMSGDNRYLDYNEPGSMRKYAMQLGVPTQAIVQDYAGRRTYDTCYRAGHIFGVQEAVLVTQEYHLPRALYICNSMGLHAIGVIANRTDSTYIYGNLRELPASLAALWEVNVSHPLPVLGNPEPIFPSDGPASSHGGGE